VPHDLHVALRVRRVLWRARRGSLAEAAEAHEPRTSRRGFACRKEDRLQQPQMQRAGLIA
jgi:hypothetical protein